VPGATGAYFSAAGARIADDLGRIELDDGWLVLPAPALVRLHVDTLALRGLSPWGRAAGGPWWTAWLRAAALVLAALAAALVSAVAALRPPAALAASGTQWARTRMGAIAVGAAGPLAALGLLRLIERRDTPASAVVAALAYACVPLVAFVGAWSATRARAWYSDRSAARAPSAHE
jgi:hypothetical protein